VIDCSPSKRTVSLHKFIVFDLGSYYVSRQLSERWVSGLHPSSRILNTRKHDVSEIGFVSVLGVKETHTLLDTLERAILNHWTTA
jgi:hypothetical protein